MMILRCMYDCKIFWNLKRQASESSMSSVGALRRYLSNRACMDGGGLGSGNTCDIYFGL